MAEKMTTTDAVKLMAESLERLVDLQATMKEDMGEMKGRMATMSNGQMQLIKILVVAVILLASPNIASALMTILTGVG